MDGVRHVSNIIAHNLRTPLGRIRSHLDEALRGEPEAEPLAKAAIFSIDEVDGLIIVLDKLLQIAEAESGARRQPFAPVALREVVTNLLELYDAAAEAQGVTLVADIRDEPVVLGDQDLLATILANLLDNALKYAGSPAKIEVRVTHELDKITLIVQDDGPGIPAAERSKVLQRFYRLNQRQQGNGLGLSIVAAVTHLHGGTLSLEDAAPGLCVCIVLPQADSATFPNGKSLERLRIGAVA
jgi:signal transduction histidine kinase